MARGCRGSDGARYRAIVHGALAQKHLWKTFVCCAAARCACATHRTPRRSTPDERRCVDRNPVLKHGWDDLKPIGFDRAGFCAGMHDSHTAVTSWKLGFWPPPRFVGAISNIRLARYGPGTGAVSIRWGCQILSFVHFYQISGVNSWRSPMLCAARLIRETGPTSRSATVLALGAGISGASHVTPQPT